MFIHQTVRRNRSEFKIKVMYCVYNRARTELVFAAQAIGVALDAEGNTVCAFFINHFI